MLAVDQLFRGASIAFCGPVPWGTAIPERGPGVYVVALADGTTCGPRPGDLGEEELARWVAGEQVVYIGRSKHLRRRLGEFYRHKHGDRRPHRGGQGIKLLALPLQVYWAAAKDYPGAEQRLLDIFRAHAGCYPFGNRIRAARQVAG